MDGVSARNRKAAEHIKKQIPKYDPKREHGEALLRKVEKGMSADDAFERAMMDDVLGRPGRGSGALGPTGGRRRTEKLARAGIGSVRSGSERDSEDGEEELLKKVADRGLEKGADLLSSMAARLEVLEKSQRQMRQELVAKDRELLRVKAEKRALEESAGEEGVDAAVSVGVLRDENAVLRKQIHAMERFLADYGLVWVGGEEEEVGSKGERVLYEGFDPLRDFEAFASKVKELNALAGSGQKRVVATKGKAKLEDAPTVPLSIFADGIALWRGPFRPLSEATTQSFISDILDGYFPYEFKDKYPHGCVFNLQNRTSQTWDAFLKEDTATLEVTPFQGQGRIAGSGKVKDKKEGDDDSTVEDRRAPSIRMSAPSSIAQIGDPTIDLRKPMSEGAFMRALPERVIRGGRVINVRENLGRRDRSKPSSTKKEDEAVILADTPALRSLTEHGGGTEDALRSTFRPQTASALEAGDPERDREDDITTLRVRSESGRQTIVLKMRYKDTIAQLRSCIDHARTKTAPYEIRTAYPSRALDDPEQTLQDAGLVPNASLLLRAVKTE